MERLRGWQADGRLGQGVLRGEGAGMTGVSVVLRVEGRGVMALLPWLA